MIWWPHDEVERNPAEREEILARFSGGPFDVILSGLNKGGSVANVRRYLYNQLAIDNASEVSDRAIHIRAEVVLAGVSQNDAVGVKIALERAGGKVTIKDGSARSSSRAAIPERVRHEVWRRDGGACVDCGSRERLEFDHSIPLSKGGSNTARNIELRCESCNRRKAATI